MSSTFMAAPSMNRCRVLALLLAPFAAFVRRCALWSCDVDGPMVGPFLFNFSPLAGPSPHVLVNGRAWRLCKRRFARVHQLIGPAVADCICAWPVVLPIEPPWARWSGCGCWAVLFCPGPAPACGRRAVPHAFLMRLRQGPLGRPTGTLPYEMFVMLIVPRARVPQRAMAPRACHHTIGRPAALW